MQVTEIEQEVIITNHNQLFHFSDPSKSFYAWIHLSKLWPVGD